MASQTTQPTNKALTRRTVLKTAAAGCLGLACGSATAASSPFGPFKVGVHSYTLRKFPLKEAIQITRDMGVKYIGLNPVHLPLDSTDEQRAEALRMLKDADLTLLACGVITFDADEKKARQAFDHARAMGMATIVANPKPESFDVLDKMVEEYDIRIAIHNHGPEGIYSVPDDVINAVKDHHKLIGACVDLGHYERSRVKAQDAVVALQDRIYDVHLKDVDRRHKDGHSVVLGEGVVDMPAVIKALLNTSMDFHMALEYELDPKNPQPAMKKSFNRFKKLVAEASATA